MVIGKKDKEKINQREELLKILKAIINKFIDQQIVVSHQELKDVEDYDIFISKEILQDAKRYQLINIKDLKLKK